MVDKHNQAIQICTSKVMAVLLESVVSGALMKDRTGGLSDEALTQISQNKRIDIRPPLWSACSGKGGIGYENNYRNVSLLDHCISVATGAITFSASKMVSDGWEVGEKLERYLFMVGLVALLHDVNKLLDGSPSLSDKKVDSLMSDLYQRWDLENVVSQYGLDLDAKALFRLINLVEAGTALTGAEGGVEDRLLRVLVRKYVRLADQLDSTFAKLGSDGGINGVLKLIATCNNILPDNLLHWRHISLFDPAHPYLLDKLLAHLSVQCRQISGLPPLLAIHHDGQLDILLPEVLASEIADAALSRFNRSLQPELSIDISTAQLPTILNGKPTWSQLSAAYLEQEVEVNNTRLLSVGRIDADYFINYVADGRFGLSFSQKSLNQKGATLSPEPFESGDVNEEHFFLISGLIILVLSHPSKSKRVKLPSYLDRIGLIEKALLEQDYKITIPDELRHQLSQRAWFGMEVAALAISNPNIYELLIGSSGILQQIYHGRHDSKGKEISGIIHGLEGNKNSPKIDLTIARIKTLLSGKPIIDGLKGRIDGYQACLVTGQPGEGKILSSDGLLGIKVSHFSNRRGRPAELGKAVGHTFVCPMSSIEYIERGHRHGSKKVKTPASICSPAVTGLFGEARMDDEREADRSDYLDLFDLSRAKLGDKKVLIGPELFTRRAYLARQESIPAKIKDQLEWILRLIRAVQRTGRPFHVFAGLPHQRPEILYIDCLPPALRRLAQDRNGFRLEELNELRDKFELASSLLNVHGSVSLINALSSPTQQYSALCKSLMLLEDRVEDLRKKNNLKEIPSLHRVALLVTERLFTLRGTNVMSKQESSIILLAQKAAGLQRAFGTGASRGKQQLIFRLILDEIRQSVRNKKTSDHELRNAIAGKLETKFKGSDMYLGAAKHRRDLSTFDACVEIADFFINEIWHQLLNARMPSQKLISQLMEIYRVEMLLIYKNRKDINEDETAELKD
ncbi:hypothetical protein LRP52_28995 [Photobacterium sp. ZSDE20]|nr:hypothetical protein [Photobacterium sp. ZSDE20]